VDCHRNRSSLLGYLFFFYQHSTRKIRLHLVSLYGCEQQIADSLLAFFSLELMRQEAVNGSFEAWCGPIDMTWYSHVLCMQGEDVPWRNRTGSRSIHMVRTYLQESQAPSSGTRPACNSRCRRANTSYLRVSTPNFTWQILIGERHQMTLACSDLQARRAKAKAPG
jgi:hypothetical protein